MVKDKTLEQTLQDIGQKLTQLRKDKGYTSHENFAFDYNLPRVQYWRMEKGKANLTIKTLRNLLIIHKLTVEDFFCMLAEANKREAS
jgi:transcriptional regulator with XRE-family HTH domain